MKNITLLGINARFTHSNLALYYIRESIKDLDFNIVLIEESINQNKFKILAEIVNSNPDIIAISTYIWNKDIVEFLVSSLKTISPSLKIVLGGPESGYNSSYWLEKELAPDYIIVGGGEAGWRYLAENNFEVEESRINIPNYYFSEIDLPYQEGDYPDLENKYVYYEASRGCPFRCSFCLSSRTDQKLDYKDVPQIKEELTRILLHKPKIIKFVDRSFNVDRRISQAVWQFINSLDTKTKFHFEVHPNLFTEADFEILENTPPERIQFEIGVQSTNTMTIKEIDRNHHFSHYKDTLKQLLEIKNIHSHLDLIIGLPYEDKDSFLNSLNDLLLLEPDVIQLGFLKVLPGTKMHDKKEEYGIICDVQPPYQILKTKWVSFKDIAFFMQFEDMFELIHNTPRLRHTLKYMTTFYNRPVDLFLNFAEYLKDKPELNNTNWISLFATFRDFLIAEKADLNTDLLDDLLSWDWLIHSRKNNLPSFLDRELNHSFKKQVFKDLKGKEPTVWESILGKNIKNLNNCAFFVARTPEFRETILAGNSKVFIFKDRVYKA
jgi:anaerobic magnesium-protoporphyrin IX monomethyl ester cyclase